MELNPLRPIGVCQKGFHQLRHPWPAVQQEPCETDFGTLLGTLYDNVLRHLDSARGQKAGGEKQLRLKLCP